MTRYQERPRTVDAVQVADGAMAAALLGGVALDAPEGAWIVEVERDGVRLSWEGAIGDYLVGDPPHVVAQATFEAAWVPMDAVLAARSVQASATTILGLRKGSLELTDSALIGGAQ